MNNEEEDKKIGCEIVCFRILYKFFSSVVINGSLTAYALEYYVLIYIQYKNK